LKQRASVIGARLAAPQPLTIGEKISPEIVADACGIGVNDIETARHPPCVASCGAAFVMAEVKSRTALAVAKPRTDVFARDLPIGRATGIHLYVPERTNDADIHCRMFAPLHGVYEDPATGSAAVALIGLLATLSSERDLTLSKTIAQGVEMGRPSKLDAVAQKSAGVVTATYVGGNCVPVMHGIVELD
jgi:trans-2,3-dihydro-3-hydroxyanthranilate isomerase